jgi:hypothetical protein
MYCSTCGNKIADNLNYCNSCGSRIEKNPLVISNASKPELAKTLGAVLVTGIIGFVVILKFLIDNPRLDASAVVIILVAYLAALTLISAICIGHMWKTAGDIRVHPKEEPESDRYSRPSAFRTTNTNQLAEPANQPIGSVTENTTRTLDEVLVDRR